jgi:hypothetical protein
VKISKRLNIVFAVDSEDGTVLHVHSRPIPSETFDQHYEVITKTYSDMLLLYGNGFSASAPQVAYKKLRDTARTLKVWEGPAGVEQNLLGEISRGTTVLVSGEQGYEQIPFYQAKQQKLIDKEDAEQIESTLIFFTCCSFTMHRSEWASLYEMLRFWYAQTTSLDSTAYANSLLTSTEDASTGETQTV